MAEELDVSPRRSLGACLEHFPGHAVLLGLLAVAWLLLPFFAVRVLLAAAAVVTLAHLKLRSRFRSGVGAAIAVGAVLFVAWTVYVVGGPNQYEGIDRYAQANRAALNHYRLLVRRANTGDQIDTTDSALGMVFAMKEFTETRLPLHQIGLAACVQQYWEKMTAFDGAADAFHLDRTAANRDVLLNLDKELKPYRPDNPYIMNGKCDEELKRSIELGRLAVETAKLFEFQKGAN